MDNQNSISNDEIDFIGIFKSLYSEKSFIFKIVVTCAFFGLFIALFSTKTFETSLTFTLSDVKDKSRSSQVSSLASLAGIDINPNENNVLSPIAYPIIFSDFKFKRDVLNIKLENNLTVKDYLMNQESGFMDILFDYTLRLPSKIMSLLRPSNNLSSEENIYTINDDYFVTEQEQILFDKIDGFISITVNEREGTINISTVFDNPAYASIITNRSFKVLQDYVINVNIKASQELLNYNEKNFLTKKEEFDGIQDRLGVFKDKNQVISSSKFSNELFKLQNDFNLINSVYQELAKQVELAKIQVTKDTPVFTVLKNAEVPSQKHTPNTRFIVIIWTFLGFIFSSAYVAFKKTIFQLIAEVKS